MLPAGHLPKDADGKMHSGKVGRDLTTEEAYKLARLVAINLIATVKGLVPSPHRPPHTHTPTLAPPKNA
jgi:hypothetical protein